MAQLETFRHYLESHFEETSFQPISNLNSSKFARLTDSKLVEHLTAGDRGAASEYWERYSQCVRGILMRIFGPHTDVEGLVHRVFLTAYGEMTDADEKGDLGPCTLKATIGVAREALRSKKKSSLFSSGKSRRKTQNLGADLSDDTWSLRMLYHVYDKLEVNSRLAFLLVHVEQMDPGDASYFMGWSEERMEKAMKKSRGLVLSRARNIVAPQAGSTTKKFIINNKDRKAKQDAAALKAIAKITQRNIDGAIDSTDHFSGRELFLHAIDEGDISGMRIVSVRTSLTLVAVAVILIALGLFVSVLMGKQMPQHNHQLNSSSLVDK